MKKLSYRSKHKKLLDQACLISKKLKVAIVYPMNAGAIEGAILAHEMGLIEPTFLGPKTQMEQLAKKVGKDLSKYEAIDLKESKDAAVYAAKLVNEKKADAVLKGSLDTGVLLGAALAKEGGFRGTRRISNCYVSDLDAYPKLLLYADVGINILPDLKTKADIVRNAVDIANSLGIKKPKIAILCCLEKVKEHIPSTIDAQALCEMAKKGEFGDVIMEGPISFDIAFSKQAAKEKNFSSKIAGDVDIAIFPNLDASNIAIKQLELFSHAQCGSLALGAKVPILINSRNTPAEERILTCAFAKLYYAKFQPNK